MAAQGRNVELSHWGDDGRSPAHSLTDIPAHQQNVALCSGVLPH